MTISELITPQWVKDRFLVGVVLTTDDGELYPDALFEIAIASAIAMVEDVCDIVFDDVAVVNERHDTFNNINNYPTYAPIRLRKRPVQSITGVACKWGQNTVLTVPVDWANRDADDGQLSFTGSVTIIPTETQMQLSTYGTIGMPWNAVAPLWWRMSYRAGWADATDIPAPLLMCIGWIASVLPLDTAGDLIAGAGIASKSVSIDGLSTSIGTTSSATNSGYGARIESYQKQISAMLAAAQAKYQVREVFCL